MLQIIDYDDDSYARVDAVLHETIRDGREHTLIGQRRFGQKRSDGLV